MLNFALCSRELPEYPCLTTATQEWTRKVTFLNLDCKKKKKKKKKKKIRRVLYKLRLPTVWVEFKSLIIEQILMKLF